MSNSSTTSNLRTSIQGARESAATFWNDRSAQERKQLLVISSVLLLTLLYLLLIAPALSGREQLRNSLPELRQKAAEMQQLSRDAAALSANIAPPPPLLSKEIMDTSLATRGLKPQSVVVSEDVVRIQLSSVSFAALVDWLGEVQKTVRLSVIDANITAQTASDTVNATLTLRQLKSESRSE
ncbi:type II secretion system protein GspM [Actimicrobium sp. CCI2.3]|uniref:type II secretion system protein GspM n=1 Tax=Actimicrobium sp. CCI2.3 TaxID=3048616 RepID=UPI002AB40126|nr:type II secretion system protein GspM [Actimicrobium sp. CCI2.3]MDY7576370.1 type II secretion system protein GspM [Actimicrobium sp. CCI2.3]MEB0020426.1 type II secretion system protein GspM [Actimicrobium sp. CCI2.3]